MHTNNKETAFASINCADAVSLFSYFSKPAFKRLAVP